MEVRILGSSVKNLSYRKLFWAYQWFFFWGVQWLSPPHTITANASEKFNRENGEISYGGWGIKYYRSGWVNCFWRLSQLLMPDGVLGKDFWMRHNILHLSFHTLCHQTSSQMGFYYAILIFFKNRNILKISSNMW